MDIAVEVKIRKNDGGYDDREFAGTRLTIHDVDVDGFKGEQDGVQNIITKAAKIVADSIKKNPRLMPKLLAAPCCDWFAENHGSVNACAKFCPACGCEITKERREEYPAGAQ